MAKTATKKQVSQPVKCVTCGKVITNPTSVTATMGSLCQKHAAAGYNAQKMRSVRAALTIPVMPKNFVKLGSFKPLIKAKQQQAAYAGLTINRLVTCIGRDRAIKNPCHAIMQVFYLPNGHRVINQWAASPAGLKAIATGNFSNAPAQQPAATLVKKFRAAAKTGNA